MKIDLTKPIICEGDPYTGEAYCIECFKPKTFRYLYFYNSQGPLCSKECYADFIGVEFEKLPNLKVIKSRIKD
jgi:hypothetical protein